MAGLGMVALDLSATDLVEFLRGEELATIRSEVEAGRRDHILKILDERGRAQELVRQQYTGRYPFELLQNANDASGDESSSGHTATFVLTREALLVADKGAGFGPPQIRAICGLGRSSKDPRKSIGYKGLGFKSVGEITDDPQVFSDSFGFRFNAADVRAEVGALVGDLSEDQRLPVYAFPLSMSIAETGEDAPEIEQLIGLGYRTVFRFPLRSPAERQHVAAHLVDTLSPRLLLFLDAVDQLELVGTDRDFVATAVKQQHNGHTEVLVEANDQTEHWLVFDREVAIPDGNLVAPLGDAWREVDRVRVAAAVPLDDAGRPSRLRPQPIHVYFPTHEESGFGLLLQADFYLELDRRRIALTPEATPFNEWLAEQVGELVGTDVAVGLADRFPGESAVVSALAVVGSPSGIGERLVDRATVALRDVAFVPTVAGARLPSEALLLPSSVPGSEVAHRMLDLSDLSAMAVPGVEQDPHARQLLVERLDASELTLEATLARLSEPATDDYPLYAAFLVRWSESAGLRRFAAALGAIPCVRTVSGQWRRPEEHLFFPRQREQVEFPAGLQVPIVDIPEVEGFRSLLEEAGVSSFEWRQLLPEYVFPLLVDPDTDSDIRQLALEALRLYFQTERSGDPRLRAQTARVLLPARRASGSDDRLVEAESVYFSSEWLDHDRLERIYGPFGKYEFLNLAPPSDPDLRREEIDFFEWLGVARHPRPDARVIDQRDIHMVNGLGRHPHTSYGELWSNWLDRPDVRDAQLCEQGHTASQQLRASYGLDRLPELTASADSARLGLVWEELARSWATHYREAQSARFYCQNTGHAGERIKYAPSLMAHMLEVLAWVPCSRKGTSDVTIPSKVWRLTRDTPRRIAERVPVLPTSLDQPWASGMYTDLGIVDSARPHPDDVVELLRQLSDEWQEIDEAAPDTKEVINAARWAMRTLNDVIGDDSVLASGDVPLLARMDGHRTFDSRPYVAEDTFLAETWEAVLPILDADRDLRQLHATLDLPSLDKLTTQTPIPYGTRPEVQDAVRADLNSALPYLAAVAIEAVPSREEEVYRGLARLEVSVCEELMVRYELNGDVRERGEAVAFIAVRQEQDGRVRRNIGTAHLELDPRERQPHWYVFGPLLARFLNVPTQGDAFSLLLAGSAASRNEYLRSRLIPDEALEEARIRLDQPPVDDDLTDLVTDFLNDEDVTFGDDPAKDPDRESTTPEGTDEASEGLGDSESDAPQDDPLPDIDHASVAITDAEVAQGGTEGTGTTRETRSGGLGPTGPVDHERRQRLQRTIGRRGEEAVYQAEQRRVAASGQDPQRVVWRSETHAFAPYDIESIDDDGQTMYIEVKATSGGDPYEHFEISHSELLWALRHRSRYYVYRVTNAHQAVPSIARFQDPIAMLRDGSADLGLRGARLAFIRPDHSELMPD